MTGELLPVTGFKDRAVAAKHGYATRLVAPAGNEHDVRQVSERRCQGLEFAFASALDQSLRAALAKHPVKGFVPPT